MLGEQSVAQVGDGRLYGRLLRFNCQVALCVQPHGAVVEVRRSHAKQSVVDKANLGVYPHLDSLVLDHRIIDMQAAKTVAARRRFKRRDRKTAMLTCSSHSEVSWGKTMTISGPSFSCNRAARASLMAADLQYWFSR